MPNITIKNVPQVLIDNIDSLVRRSSSPDRSTYLITALKDYYLFHDQYFMHCLPDTIRILAEDIMKKDSQQREEYLNYTLTAVKKCEHLMEQFVDILSSGDYGELSSDEDYP